jgi:hypothetical protein
MGSLDGVVDLFTNRELAFAGWCVLHLTMEQS